MGPSDWASLYDASRPETVFVNHPYATANYYYLARATAELPVGGAPARIGARDGTMTDPGLVPAGDLPGPRALRAGRRVLPRTPRRCTRSTTAGLPWEKLVLARGQAGRRRRRSPWTCPAPTRRRPSRLRVLAWGLDYNLASVRHAAGPLPVRELQRDGLPPARASTTCWPRSTTPPSPGCARAGTGSRCRCPTRPTPLNPNRIGHLAAWRGSTCSTPGASSRGADGWTSTRPRAGTGDVVYRIGPFDSASPAPPYVFDVTDACRPVAHRRRALRAGGGRALPGLPGRGVRRGAATASCRPTAS